MLDITGKDIAELDDTDLRTLVARLCTAELREYGLPIAGVTAGGDQNAPDGGIDVRVVLESGVKPTDFIPRPGTGFQVKVPDMGSAEISKEMCPKGHVRPVIQELARDGGAYIIVSSKGSTADRALRNRQAAMRKAVRDVPNSDNLVLDFYDRDRIASWVSLYPGVAFWVRERLGKPLKGWQAYGNWSAPRESPGSEYLRDGKCRIYDGRTSKDGSLTIEQGLSRLRDALSRPTGTVRLIGLSGVGKTRLVQALFDATVGDNPVDPSVAIYTDLADAPTPSPRDLIQQLVQSRLRTVVIVDNCLPTTHRALASACSVTESRVSLLTVEYDVGEDDPEDTDVFRLEAASDGLIEQLVAQRAPQVSQVDRKRIADFSGGNAKVALALGRTVRRGDSIASFTDEELFKRLFHQRHSEDRSLLRAAEACSLVYSFDGETSTGVDAELPILADLAGLSLDELYRHIAELKARDLLQQRSKWRAVLPHALANKLASHALDRLMPERICDVLISKAPDRLKQSFSRRLGYLHDNQTAQKIVGSWLSDGGFLSDINTLGPTQLAMFHNVAPVAPEKTIDALERALNGHSAKLLDDLKNLDRYPIAVLLRSLAYEPQFFERACELLARFVIAGPPNNNYNSTKGLFQELFHLYLSGTHAPVTLRLQVVEKLLNSEAVDNQNCGLMALGEMLKTEGFSSFHGFDFGARSRDYGWHPQTFEEIWDWYRSVLRFVLDIVVSNISLIGPISSIIARKFQSLWLTANTADELQEFVDVMAVRGFWLEGWISVRNTLRFDSNEMPEEVFKRLLAIEETLRPTGLLYEARAYVFSGAWGELDVADGEEEAEDEPDKAYQKVEERTRSIGRRVATRHDILDALLPDLFTCHKVDRRWAFGMGLAEGADDIDEMWQTLVKNLMSISLGERNIQVLLGFLSGAVNLAPARVAEWLDATVTDPALGPLFPILQCAVPIDEAGINRLLVSAQLGLASASGFIFLADGRVSDPIAAYDLRRLLMAISASPGGLEVALDILFRKLHTPSEPGITADPELIECGRHLLLRRDYSELTDMDDYKLAGIANSCLEGVDAKECATTICKTMVQVFSSHVISFYNYVDLLKILFRAQPNIAMTIFVGDQSICWRLGDIGAARGYILDEVPEDILFSWANVAPSERYPALASAIRLFTGGDSNREASLAPQAIALLDLAPDKAAILSGYEERLYPSNWSGSLADIFEARRSALQPLATHQDPVVVNWVKECDRKLKRWADDDRLRDRAIDERFE
ncbi:hypothetical protein [Methylococcus sp. EFPC2]|uniref:hypothetical protein n=1 Tax=Methylococcus sp. EFPC2 TaxID=2812648 RepID=UPI0019678CEC|nr:hypothetical protein [Methylococcus sp. EFPC2]QSA95716.1 hypothetical protein JWZ97_10695 [Methylococcus sp. EFPC2]